jgi:cytochrome b561
MESPKRYHPALVTLHWLVALLVFVNLYLGIITFENRGGGPGNFQAMNPLVAIHMMVGITLIVLLTVRFVVRMKTSKPAEATAGNTLLDLLAKIVHYGLYLTVLAVTILGLIFSLQTGRFQSTFLGAESQFGPPAGGFPQAQGTPGAEITPPDQNGTMPQNGGAAPNFQGGRPRGGGFSLLIIHEFAAYTLLVLVTLHIFATLYHQFVRGDNLISRMWYGQR